MLRKKILFYAPSIEFGGGESYVFNLVNELLTKFECEILVLTPCVKLIESLSVVNAKVVSINTSPTIGFKCIQGLIFLSYNIKLFKPEIVFLNGLAESGSLSRFIYKGEASFVSIGHSNEYWLKSRDNSSVKIFLRKVLTYNFFKFLDKVIVITEEALDSVKTQRLFDCKVLKIYNGTPAICSAPSFGSSDIVTFGRISRLCEGKGNELLIKAFSKLIQSGYKARLLIAGTGEQMEYLEHLVKEVQLTEFVRFLGHVAPVDFFNKIDCMVSPSLMEGLPTVISEAFSCHTPVISTSVGGVPEMIKHKFSGYLIEPYSEDEISTAFKKFIDDRASFERFAVNGYYTYLDNFSIEISVKKTWDYLNE